MKRDLKPARKIAGEICVPGDKSIAHRVALFSILAKEPIEAINYPSGADCQRSLEAARQLGVGIEVKGSTVKFTPPVSSAVEPDTLIDCGNSGTTARLLCGLLAGRDVEVSLTGDESLRSRPMKRIIDPLTEMGAELFSDEGKLPIRIRGRKLLPLEYRLPVASAQVKSALLLAGLASSSSVTIWEDSITRDHTEIMISAIGEGLSQRKITPRPVPDPIDPRKKKMVMPESFKKEVQISSQARLLGGTIDIPGDISTASFFFAAAAIGRGTVTVKNLGLNPTRTAFIDYLKAIGCAVSIVNRSVVSGESRGDVTVSGGELRPRKISGETTVNLIDEIPVLAMLASFVKGKTLIRDAGELRVKESDRLEAISRNLTLMNVKHGLLDDGLAIEGGTDYSGADFESFGDHRIAMAFSIASLFLIGPSTIDDDAVKVSCPNFYDLLDEISS